MDEKEKYDVALSFAGEQREYVEEVALGLSSLGIFFFYDENEAEKDRLSKKHLVEEFHDIYENKAHLVVMFISKEYVKKPWPRHERRSTLSGAIQNKTDYLLVRFDDSPVPGIPTDRYYLRTCDYTPAELALRIAVNIGHEVLPEHNIHVINDDSFGNTKRLVYRIEVPDVYSEAQGRMIAEHIAETRHTKGNLVNALGFFFYFPVADPNSRADGSINWAPNGEWADAITVQTGDYRNYRFKTQFWNERSLPTLYHGTRVRMDIFRKIAQAETRGRVESEREGGTLERRIELQRGLAEQYKRELSETHSLSGAELKKIMVEGVMNNWPLK